MIDEMSRADASQVEASLTSGIETHRGLEMLDRRLRFTGEQAQPPTPTKPFARSLSGISWFGLGSYTATAS
jgi:hypothetical protein